MSKINIGIIGLGVGFAHLKACMDAPSCGQITVCDFDANKLEEARRAYPDAVPAATDEEILRDPDIDVVVIASYDNYHYEQILAAIEQDKHVFAEKPLCQFRRQAEDIRKALNKHPEVRLGSNLILRKYERMKAIKTLIDNGTTGRPYYLEADYNYGRLDKITQGWRGKLDYYSVVAGGGIHMIDLVLWLSGGKAVETFAYGNRISTQDTQFKFNDTVVSLLEFEDGRTAKIACNFACVFPHFHHVMVYGSNATIINDFEYGKLFTHRDVYQGYQKIETPYKGVTKAELFMDFIDSIVSDRPAEITTDEIFEAMSVCFSIEESVESGKPVRVNYI